MDGFRVRWGVARSLHKSAFAAIAGPAAVTLLAILEERPETAVVALLYVLAVVVVARVGGALAGVASSLVSFLALNFFFTKPLHTLAVGAPEDLIAAACFPCCLGGRRGAAVFDSACEGEGRATRARGAFDQPSGDVACWRVSPPTRSSRISRQGVCDVFDLHGCEIETTFTSTARLTHGELNGRSERVQLTARALRTSGA